MSNRVLVKLMPMPALAAASSNVKLRPLANQPVTPNAFGLSTDPAWYVAELPDTVGPNPWDVAHARVADQLGIDESGVLFAEPDLEQHFDDQEFSRPGGFGIGDAPDPCSAFRQDNQKNKAVGPANANNSRAYTDRGIAGEFFDANVPWRIDADG